MELDRIQHVGAHLEELILVLGGSRGCCCRQVGGVVSRIRQEGLEKREERVEPEGRCNS